MIEFIKILKEYWFLIIFFISAAGFIVDLNYDISDLKKENMKINGKLDIVEFQRIREVDSLKNIIREQKIKDMQIRNKMPVGEIEGGGE